jgi:hypothetical protein
VNNRFIHPTNAITTLPSVAKRIANCIKRNLDPPRYTSQGSTGGNERTTIASNQDIGQQGLVILGEKKDWSEAFQTSPVSPKHQIDPSLHLHFTSSTTSPIEAPSPIGRSQLANLQLA